MIDILYIVLMIIALVIYVIASTFIKGGER